MNGLVLSAQLANVPIAANSTANETEIRCKSERAAKRNAVLHLLGNMPAAVTASHVEVMTFIDRHKLADTGVGYVDAALLASTALTAGARLWARDKHLRAAAMGARLVAKGLT